MTDDVLMETRGAVALLTLNRPEKLNALNYATIDRLMQRLDAVEADPALRAVILTGAGRAFSAGGDIPEFTQSIAVGPDVALREFVHPGQAMTARIEAFEKPVIVAVNGLAYGGGCEVTEAAHLAVAAESARFAKPEVAIAIPPTFGGTQRLPRLAGRKRALEHLLTGDPFDAQRALEIGIVNRIVPDGKVVEAAFELAERILRHSPLTVARILNAATRGLNMPIDEGLRVEAAAFARMAATRDVHEGLAAWIERRDPHYSGE